MSDAKHSIHCRGYRGCDVGFDDEDCDCGATMRSLLKEIERLRAELQDAKRETSQWRIFAYAWCKPLRDAKAGGGGDECQ